MVYDCEDCGTYRVLWGREPDFNNHHKLILKQFYSSLGQYDQRMLDICLSSENIDEIV